MILFFLKYILYGLLYQAVYCHTAYLTYTQSTSWQPTPVLLPGKSHGQRSLEGCSPWDC